jgi:hypothetical protein
MTFPPPPRTAKAVASVASTFAGTYSLDGVDRLWVRPRGHGFEFVCMLKPGNQNVTMEEVEVLVTETASTLEEGATVNVVFVKQRPSDPELVSIEIPS